MAELTVTPEIQTFDGIKKLMLVEGLTLYGLACKGVFKNLKPYPKKSDFTDIVEKCECCGRGTVKISVEEQMKKSKDEYHEEESRIYKLFKQLLFSEYNIGPKKGNIIFQVAWEDGHASGYGEVVSYFEKYMDLVYQFNLVKED